MNVYKVELLIVDHDHVGPDEVRAVLENANYPNDCISPRVMYTQTREVEWSDDHPLNSLDRVYAEYRRLFPSPYDSNPLPPRP